MADKSKKAVKGSKNKITDNTNTDIIDYSLDMPQDVKNAFERLNERQQMFCDLYCTKYYHVAYLAYMEAYPSVNENSARRTSSRLLTNVDVKTYVKYLDDKTRENLHITMEDTLKLQYDSIISSMMGLKVDTKGIAYSLDSLRKALGYENKQAEIEDLNPLAKMIGITEQDILGDDYADTEESND